jgi:hypothetical protein
MCLCANVYHVHLRICTNVHVRLRYKALQIIYIKRELSHEKKIETVP